MTGAMECNVQQKKTKTLNLGLEKRIGTLKFFETQISAKFGKFCGIDDHQILGLNLEPKMGLVLE
jgi:hypothetical protein